MNKILVREEFLFIKELFYYFNYKMEYLKKNSNAYGFPVAYFHKTRIYGPFFNKLTIDIFILILKKIGLKI